MPPAALPLFPGLDPPVTNASEAEDDRLTAELVKLCQALQLPAVLPDTIEADLAWGANCGPMALAAVLGLPTVEAVRPLVQPFRGFMSPTDMTTALRKSGASFTCTPMPRLTDPERAKLLCMPADHLFDAADPWPVLGLVRIQWLGGWCAPGVNPRAAYRHTHWIGVRTVIEPPALPGAPVVMIYDATPNRWIPLWAWERWCPTLWPKRTTGWAPVNHLDVALPTGVWP